MTDQRQHTEHVGHPHVDSFFGANGLVPARLGEYVQQLGHVRVGVDDRLWRYRTGVYRPDGDTFARTTMRQILGERFRARHLTEVTQWLKAHYPSVGERPPEQWINTSNGLLNWRSGELDDHTPDVVTTVQIPVPWRPDATCPAIDTFLSQVLPAGAAGLVLEIVGYALYPGNPLRRAVLLLGPGRNGKSVLLGIIKAILGATNCSAIPLQTLAENRFAAADLFGKLANISGDLDARAVRSTDVFKMATGNDAITAERKYGQAFTFTPFATFLFAANEAPISSDQTDAWFDRWVVIPLDRRIPDDEIDPHLLARLTTPDELAGLLVRSVGALRNLMGRGRFDLPPSVQEAGAIYRDQLDTVRGFVGDECVLHDRAWVPRSALYAAYRKWAADSGRLPVSVQKFNEHLRRQLPGRITEAGRKGIKGWAGIGLSAAEGAE